MSSLNGHTTTLIKGPKESGIEVEHMEAEKLAEWIKTHNTKDLKARIIRGSFAYGGVRRVITQIQGEGRSLRILTYELVRKDWWHGKTRKKPNKECWKGVEVEMEDTKFVLDAPRYFAVI